MTIPQVRPRDDRRAWGMTVARFAERWGRIGVLLVAALAQVGVLVATVIWLSEHSWIVYAVMTALSGLVLVAILDSDRVVEYKLAWAIPLLLLPLAGGAFFLLFGRTRLTRRERLRAADVRDRARAALDWVPQAPMPEEDAPAAFVRTLDGLAGYKPFEDTVVEYFPTGDEAFPRMLADIAAAQRYVFCEYYIVADGEMWERLFAVLAERATAGVDVRVLYDDLGSLFTLPLGFRRRLRDAGIKVLAVGELGPLLQLRANNRDHRKILSVDGRVAYTGGINIGDEYINRKRRFGHWKDVAVRLEGPGAWPFAVMFVEGWDLVSRQDTDLRLFEPSDARALPDPADQPTVEQPVPPGRSQPSGIVLPYDDNPFDNRDLGASAYRAVLRTARHSVDLYTPYLVVGDEMLNALGDLAAAGLRVRVVTPGIPDKRLVYEVTRSMYGALIRRGVEVYEYTPGFLHAKCLVVDGEQAVVGSTNFDYRSLYLQRECGVWIYRNEAVAHIAADVEATVDASRRVTDDLCDVPWWRRLLRAVLGAFAPLM